VKSKRIVRNEASPIKYESKGNKNAENMISEIILPEKRMYRRSDRRMIVE
jgi:hypothetical protein